MLAKFESLETVREELRRRLARRIGTIEIATEFQKVLKEIPKGQTREQVALTFLSLRSKIPSEAWPKDLSRFSENCYALIELLQKKERREKRDHKIDIYAVALAEISAFVEAHPADLFPRSLSLFQLVFGVLTKDHEFPADTDKCFPISAEMEMMFPHVKAITNRFQFV